MTIGRKLDVAEISIFSSFIVHIFGLHYRYIEEKREMELLLYVPACFKATIVRYASDLCD